MADDPQDDPLRPLTDDELKAAEVGGVSGEKDEGELIAPIPPNAPIPPVLRSGAAIMWTYHEPEGGVLFHVLRFDPPGKPKQILPLTLRRIQGGLQWRWKAFPPPRPLYNLHLLAARPEAPVIICEGEKAADAAQQIFPDFVATTSPGGAKAAGQADWTPLAGRTVIIWPDNDEPGAAYAREITATLVAQGPAVSIIDVGKLAELDGRK